MVFAHFYRYFTQGFPVVMFTHLIPFAFGVYKASPRQQNLAWLILWTIVVYRYGVTNFFFVLRRDHKGEVYNISCIHRKYYQSVNFLILRLMR